jgi:hypothetical protein
VGLLWAGCPLLQAQMMKTTDKNTSLVLGAAVTNPWCPVFEFFLTLFNRQGEQKSFIQSRRRSEAANWSANVASEVFVDPSNSNDMLVDGYTS